MGGDGWPFATVDSFPDATDDPHYSSKHIKDLYFRADPHYEGKFTVPVLWDKKTHTVVNNESSEIIRMLNSAFDDFLPEEKKKLDYYPEPLRKEIDELNHWIYSDINSTDFIFLENYWLTRRRPGIIDGVYRAGFATTQEAYNKAVKEVFDALDKVEAILAKSGDFLVGGKLTEADIRLWVTIVCCLTLSVVLAHTSVLRCVSTQSTSDISSATLEPYAMGIRTFISMSIFHLRLLRSNPCS